MASRTRASVSGASTSGRFSALDAVPSDTPARSATSLIVTLPCAERCPGARDLGGFGGSLRRSVTVWWDRVCACQIDRGDGRADAARSEGQDTFLVIGNPLMGRAVAMTRPSVRGEDIRISEIETF